MVPAGPCDLFGCVQQACKTWLALRGEPKFAMDQSCGGNPAMESITSERDAERMVSSERRKRRYWLLKSEPTSFSFDDLVNAPLQTTAWDGVRNYQARNMMRDDMQPGDLAFFYHSSCDPTGLAGIAEVVRGGYADPTALDSDDSHYDPKSNKESPIWFVVDVKAVKAFPRIITLAELRSVTGLEKMVLLQRGSRLSVQPVTEEEWTIITDTFSPGLA